MLDVVNASLNEVKEVVKKTKCAARQKKIGIITHYMGDDSDHSEKSGKDTESYSDCFRSAPFLEIHKRPSKIRLPTCSWHHESSAIHKDY